MVRNSLKPLLDEGADTIVLGCTHYPFLTDVIRKVAGPDVTVIDPAPAVARHLMEVMQEEGLLAGSGLTGKRTGHSEFISSGPDTVLKKMAARLNL